MRKQLKPIGSKGFPGGYKADPRNRRPNELASPSVNVRLTPGFSAITRAGYSATSWDLGEAGKTAMPFYVKRFNVILFAVGTKVKYVDLNDSNAVRDTGITLTDGTTTRFEESAGQVLLTNKTDGQRLILFTKLNDAAAESGDSTVTVDIDGSARMDRFGTALSGVGALRIRGTSEPYTSLVATTGVITLTGTLSQDYPNDTIATVVWDISSNRPKASKLIAWLNSINALNVSEQDASSTSDVPPSALHFTDFFTAATIEKQVAWSGGSAGTELVDKAGILTNGIATNNNLYLFKEDKTFRIPVSSVNKSNGARPPQPFLDNEGCANDDSAANMGSHVVFATRSRRILRIRYANENGSDVEQLDNAFDDDVLPLLQILDENYWIDCHMHYDVGERILYFQGSFGGEVITLCYENRPIYNDEGQILSEGRWLPPDRNKNFRLYFNVGSDLYATAVNDDTVYKVNDGTSDDGADIECQVAFGKIEPGVTAMFKEITVKGGLTQPTSLVFEPIVNDSEGTQKTITAEGSVEGEEVGSVLVGDSAISGSGMGAEMIDFEKRLAIYPSLGSSMQPVFSAFGDGHGFRIDSYFIDATAYPRSTLTLS